MDGELPSTLPRNSISFALRGLEALRHKAFVNKDQTTLEQVESKIKDIKQMQMSPPRVRQRKPVITPREQTTISKVVDALLEGQEIDSIADEAVPYLEEALQQRRLIYSSEGKSISARSIEYMKRIDTLLVDLVALRHAFEKRPRFDPRSPERVSQYEESIREKESQIQALEAEFKFRADEIEAERDNSHTVLFGAIEEGLVKLEDAKDEIDMGLAFHPSGTLLAMRAHLAKLVQVGELDRAAETRRVADAREAEERQGFDHQNRQFIENKEKIFEEGKRPKIDVINAYWNDKLEKAHEKLQFDRQILEREIEGLKRRISELQDKIKVEAESNARLMSYVTEPTEEEEERHSVERQSVEGGETPADDIPNEEGDEKEPPSADLSGSKEGEVVAPAEVAPTDEVEGKEPASVSVSGSGDGQAAEPGVKPAAATPKKKAKRKGRSSASVSVSGSTEGSVIEAGETAADVVPPLEEKGKEQEPPSADLNGSNETATVQSGEAPVEVVPQAEEKGKENEAPAVTAEVSDEQQLIEAVETPVDVVSQAEGEEQEKEGSPADQTGSPEAPPIEAGVPSQEEEETKEKEEPPADVSGSTEGPPLEAAESPAEVRTDDEEEEKEKEEPPSDAGGSTEEPPVEAPQSSAEVPSHEEEEAKEKEEPPADVSGSAEEPPSEAAEPSSEAAESSTEVPVLEDGEEPPADVSGSAEEPPSEAAESSAEVLPQEDGEGKETELSAADVSASAEEPPSETGEEPTDAAPPEEGKESEPPESSPDDAVISD
jgi:hypothetical protein